jgi:galactose mutarotase-like enzyme
MVGERTEDGLAALTLESPALGGLMAIFVPEAGMVCCSLRHRGEELLGQRGGLAGYVEAGSTMGIPFLHPWANRLGASRFEVGGRPVDLELGGLHLKRDERGLPIHGLLGAAPGWRVSDHLETEDGGMLAAGFDFGLYPRLLDAFPFPHRVQIAARLTGAELTIVTTVHAGEEGPVPISFGFHPYMRLPGVPRSEWVLTAPVRECLLLDERMLPTGRREAARIETAPLGSRAFDDPFLAPEGAAAFALEGGGRRIEVRIGDGYPYCQLYVPGDDETVAIEPMTAPTNALLSGEGLTMLPAGEGFSARFSIAISESPA